MKKIFSIASLLLVAALAFTSCSKDETNAPEESVNKSFSIVANLNDTKVTIDNALKSSWEDGDQMNVFHAATGTTAYTNDNAFSYAEGRFTGELGTALTDGASYDWYAIYPFNNNIKTPGTKESGYCYVGSDSRFSQEQTGNSNATHLAGSTYQKGVYPLVGKVENVAANSTPSVTMKHVCSYIKVHVKNTLTEPIKISEVRVTMDNKWLIGAFLVDFSNPDNCDLGRYNDYQSASAKLSVVNGEDIEANGEADFYLGIAPQALVAGDKMSVVINATYVTSGKSATQTKELTMTGSVDFKAGHIKTLNFNLSKATNITASDKTVQAGSTVAIGATVNSGATLTYSSSDNSVATVDATGTITGVSEGTATITITAPEYDGFPEATKEITVTVTSAGTKYFVKVTETPTDWSGEYLIVYDAGGLAFNGGLTTLDVVGNTIAVSIVSDQIEATADLLGATFTINAAGTTIKSKSGNFIGQATDANGLKTGATELENSITVSTTEATVKSSGGAYLRYNDASNQKRFRYYKSGTYFNQKPIQLYRLQD